MAKKITYDWHTATQLIVTIPVTKKHNIKLLINDAWTITDGIYPPSLDICICDKPVTDAYIRRTPDQTIAPTCENLKTAIELIEEAEYRMKERVCDAISTDEE